MQALNSCEISSMQATLASTYDVSCEVTRPTVTQGSLGYEITTATTTIATVMVSVKQPSANILATYADQIGAQAIWQVRMPQGQDVQRLDRLLIAGQELIVQVVLEPQSFPIETNVLVSQVKGQGQVQHGE